MKGEGEVYDYECTYEQPQFFAGFQENEVPNARIRQLCIVRKGVTEKIDGVLRWPCSVDRPRKRWMDTVKDA